MDETTIPNEIIEFLKSSKLTYTYSIAKVEDSNEFPEYMVLFSKPTPSSPIPSFSVYMHLQNRGENFFFKFKGDKLWTKVRMGEFKEEWIDMIKRMKERVLER